MALAECNRRLSRHSAGTERDCQYKGAPPSDENIPNFEGYLSNTYYGTTAEISNISPHLLIGLLTIKTVSLFHFMLGIAHPPKRPIMPLENSFCAMHHIIL